MGTDMNTRYNRLIVIVGVAVLTLPAVGAVSAYGSETATATIQLASTQVVGAQTQYTYDLALKNTSTDGSTIGSFWFSWIVAYSFLPRNPVVVSSPTGWEDGPSSIPVGGDLGGGASIEWQSTSSAGDLAAGDTLSGFSFTTLDSLATLEGTNSTSGTALPILTSFVYMQQPFSDLGYQFVVSVVPEPATLGILGLGLMPLMMRRRRSRVLATAR